MVYGSTILATDFGPDTWQLKLIRCFLFFIPRGCPDHEKLYRFVKKWLLEIDDAGVPVREIGLNDQGVPLFAAPDDRNVGFWTDSPKTFVKDELEAISAEEFERNWIEAQKIKVRK